MKPGCRTVTTDTCVPISRLADCVTKLGGGRGRGPRSTSSSAMWATATSTSPTWSTRRFPRSARPPSGSTTSWSQRALALDGTCTGEHGVGLHKMGFLVDEAGAGAVDLMRTIKRALDPKNIMNPGKIFAL